MATPQEERDAVAAKIAGRAPVASTDRDGFLARLRGVLPSKLVPGGPGPLEEFRAKLEGKPIAPDPAVVAAPIVQRSAVPAQPEAVAAVSMPVVRRPMDEPKLELKMPTIGGAGGGGANPLQQAVLDARRKQLGTLGEERELTGDLGASRAGRMMATSDLGEQEALRQQAAAERQRQVDEEAHTKMQGYLERNQKRADEIGSMKVDPHRLMRDATAGQQVAMAIGSMLGGGLAAMKGGANRFQEHLDKAIDRDINAQMTAIDNKKTALSESRSIFGQLLQETGDARAAANEYRAQIYKSAQVSLQAKADALGIPEAQANAALGMNAIQQKIDGLGVQNADAAWRQFQQQAAAAASARAAAEEKAFQRAMQVNEAGRKAFDSETARLGVSAKGEKGSDLDPRFVATGKDAQGNATGYVARSPEEAAKKEDGRVAAQKAIDLIDDTLRIRKEQGGVGRTLGRQFAWTVPEWQTQVRSNEAQLKASVNKAAHLGTLDKGTEPLLNAMAGDLESAGESSDVKLMQLRASLEKQMAAETSGAAGQAAVKTVDPRTGRAVVVPQGNVNAPASDMPAAAAGTKDR